MSTIDLKQPVAKKEGIASSNVSKAFSNDKASEEIYMLNDFEKSRLESARQQLKSNQTISHTTLKNDVDQWLNSKLNGR